MIPNIVHFVFGLAADFGGKPHIYESQFSDAEDPYTDRFLLMEIEAELFQLALEDWAIWLRWHAAFQRGDATIDRHPALSEDRERHEELKQLVGDRLCAVPGKSIMRGAEFRCVGKGWDGFEVRWLEVAT